MASSKEEGSAYGYAYEYRPQRQTTSRFFKRGGGKRVPCVGSAPTLPTPGGERNVQTTDTEEALDASRVP
jgi:hypothetical protein